MIVFNKPYLSGKEILYIHEAVLSQKISGDGVFTKKCHQFLETRFGFNKTLLTTSCTDALEMAALLCNIAPGDEVIMPSFTFVSTANAFVLRGAKIVFAESYRHNPNMDPDKLEELITPKTKAIVPVHYAGVACDMDKILALAKKYNLFVIEDAAQAIDSYYKGKPLGTFGQMAAFSFHETKNIISGEGGMIVVNDSQYVERAEIIREKGTNRSKFYRGEVDKYGWIDLGSSYLPSDIIAAFLYAQLENMEPIQARRKAIWNRFYEGLKDLETQGLVKLAEIPDYATNNAHMFYLVLKDLEQRTAFMERLRANAIFCVFHYQSLHTSPFYGPKHDGRVLTNVDRFSDCLVRLPFYFELTDEQQDKIIEVIRSFFLHK